jgi:hypothetical protein
MLQFTSSLRNLKRQAESFAYTSLLQWWDLKTSYAFPQGEVICFSGVFYWRYTDADFRAIGPRDLNELKAYIDNDGQPPSEGQSTLIRSPFLRMLYNEKASSFISLTAPQMGTRFISMGVSVREASEATQDLVSAYSHMLLTSYQTHTYIPSPTQVDWGIVRDEEGMGRFGMPWDSTYPSPQAPTVNGYLPTITSDGARFLFRRDEGEE